MIEMTNVRPGELGDARAALFLDLDYAILAADPHRYLEYIWQLRAECPWWLRCFYKSRRAAFLEQVIARERIFLSSAFLDAESVARENIRCAIALGCSVSRATGSRRAVTLRDNAIVLLDGGTGVETTHLFHDIAMVLAHKIDLVTDDRIQLVIGVFDQGVLSISEDALGAQKLFMSLEHVLPNMRPWHEWFLEVAFPAFEPNRIVLFRR